MSILQEYNSIKNKIGKERYEQIVRFLRYNPQYSLSDVYYKETVWAESEKWMRNNGISPAVLATQLVDFCNKISSEEEFVTDYNADNPADSSFDCFNVIVDLFDDEIEKLVDRTNLLKKRKISFEKARNKTNTNFEITADFYANGNIKATIYLQSEDIGFDEEVISLSKAEENSLKSDIDRVLKIQNTTIEQIFREIREERMSFSI
ncbi:MAG: hypothetical protein IJ330_07625 [Oscillospiraceae bacterium]|nr:hypothetical protein [Oscillospiraceae bacterium]